MEASDSSGSGPHAGEQRRTPSRAGEAKGWCWCLNPSALNQPSWKQGHEGCSRNEEEDERVVPPKRFCERLHKKECFFPWELKLGEQSGRARCEPVCGSIPTLLLLSRELFQSPPCAPSVGAWVLSYVKRSQASAACSMVVLIAGYVVVAY